MLEREEFNGTSYIDYGFAIAHFVNATTQLRPLRIHSRFEMLQCARPDGFQAHAEYTFVDSSQTVHKADVFGSETVMSAQPQSISEAIKECGVEEVEGRVHIDPATGEVFQRFYSDDPDASHDMERAFSHWQKAIFKIHPHQDVTVQTCTHQGHLFADVQQGNLHFSTVIKPTYRNKLHTALRRFSSAGDKIADLSPAASWLHNVTACAT
jgi:hypothetical protein